MGEPTAELGLYGGALLAACTPGLGVQAWCIGMVHGHGAWAGRAAPAPAWAEVRRGRSVAELAVVGKLGFKFHHM